MGGMKALLRIHNKVTLSPCATLVFSHIYMYTYKSMCHIHATFNEPYDKKNIFKSRHRGRYLNGGWGWGMGTQSDQPQFTTVTEFGVPDSMKGIVDLSVI